MGDYWTEPSLEDRGEDGRMGRLETGLQGGRQEMGILTSPFPSSYQPTTVLPGTFVTLDINCQPNYMTGHSDTIMVAQNMGKIEI